MPMPLVVPKVYNSNNVDPFSFPIPSGFPVPANPTPTLASANEGEVVTMFLKTSLCLTAAAAASVSGFSIPDWGQFAVDSGLALTGLNSIALLNAMANTKGSCNIGNLKFRQEWYVISVPFDTPTSRKAPT